VKNHNDGPELEKLKIYVVNKIQEYVPNAIVSKTILKKLTGDITLTSFDAGEEQAAKISPFDTFIQILEGTALLHINGVKILLSASDVIIIPAHASQRFSASKKFKMMSTTIKSGYEE
jgi:quercetin dioxygenase-like cupin family protein